MSLPVHLAPGLAGAAPGDLVELTGDEAHHAVAVRRLGVGERLVLTDGAGTAVTGSVTATGKRLLTVRVEDVRQEPRPEPEIVVVQAVPKGDRGELAVELLTEVGVAHIVPWAASRCVAVWKGERVAKGVERWRRTAREAGKQARRIWAAQVAELALTDEVAGLVAGAGAAFVLHEDADRALSGVPLPAGGRVVLVVGPEGGLTAEELAQLAAAGAQPVRLGDEVLRTSSAGMAAAAAVLSRTDRWR